MDIKFGSVCSGIEAASVAWNPLGFSASWLSEIEKFPAELLAYRYPRVQNIGDMLKAPKMVRGGEIPAPDILVGGTPCQSFSVAGMRQGLSDERGQLTMSFVDLANEIDKQRVKNGEQESIIVWENVPGVLSSKDNAFGCFLGALAGESCELQPAGRRWTNAGYILGPQRAIAWRILDAQYFGVAQRRRRVFVVASARAGFCPAKVLFEFEGVRRDTPPSRETGKEAARNVEAGASQTVVRELTLERYAQDETASTMMARDYKSYTDLVAFAQNTRDEARYIGGDGQITGALEASPGMKQTTYIALNSPQAQAVAMTCATKQQSLTCGNDLASTLAANDYKEMQAVATQTAVRRLTPIECERLQGFPDGWTQIPWRNQPAEDCPDGHRYKALGNSMAVPVMRWIGERILKELKGEL